MMRMTMNDAPEPSSPAAPNDANDADADDAALKDAGTLPVRRGRMVLPSIETPTLTKAELADLLFERLGLNKRESKDMVEAFFGRINSALVAGDDFE
jgi:hypothetical protein